MSDQNDIIDKITARVKKLQKKFKELPNDIDYLTLIGEVDTATVTKHKQKLDKALLKLLGFLKVTDNNIDLHKKITHSLMSKYNKLVLEQIDVELVYLRKNNEEKSQTVCEQEAIITKLKENINLITSRNIKLPILDTKRTNINNEIFVSLVYLFNQKHNKTVDLFDFEHGDKCKEAITYNDNNNKLLNLLPNPYCYEINNNTILKLDKIVDDFDIIENVAYEIVDTKLKLMKAIEELQKAHFVTIALEQHDYHSYKGYVTHIIISTKINNSWRQYFIDCLKLRLEVFELNRITTNKHIIKILCNLKNEIKSMQRDFGIYFVGLVDVSLLTSSGRNIKSLDKLLKVLVGYQTDKSVTLIIDYRLRPLPHSVVSHIRSIGLMLVKLYNILLDKIVHNEIITKSSQQALGTYHYPHYSLTSEIGPIQMLQKSDLKSIRYEQFVVFVKLHEWRDQRARLDDENILYIMSNTILLKIVTNLPLNVNQLQDVIGVEISPTVKTNLYEIVDVIVGGVKMANNHMLSNNLIVFNKTYDREDLYEMYEDALHHNEPLPDSPANHTKTPHILNFTNSNKYKITCKGVNQYQKDIEIDTETKSIFLKMEITTFPNPNLYKIDNNISADIEFQPSKSTINYGSSINFLNENNDKETIIDAFEANFVDVSSSESSSSDNNNEQEPLKPKENNGEYNNKHQLKLLTVDNTLNNNNKKRRKLPPTITGNDTNNIGSNKIKNLRKTFKE